MKISLLCVIAISAFVALLVFFIVKNTHTATASATSAQLTIGSNAFANNASIPRIHTCDGTNISPELHWTYQQTDSSAQSKQGQLLDITSYVLIVDDPDAQKVVGKTFVHWIILLSAHITQLPEGISGNNQSSISSIDQQAVELPNDYNNAWYNGPCPPPTSGTHTYRFSLFATSASIETIKTTLQTAVPFTAEKFKQTMQSKIIAEVVLTGTYSRDAQ